MRQIQVIERHGRSVALALADNALVTGPDRAIVAAMAL
jgi:hypothetical protein